MLAGARGSGDPLRAWLSKGDFGKQVRRTAESATHLFLLLQSLPFGIE